jgi:hypothetical protein
MKTVIFELDSCEPKLGTRAPAQIKFRYVELRYRTRYESTLIQKGVRQKLDLEPLSVPCCH